MTILRCPVTRSGLRRAEPEELARVRRALATGALQTLAAGAEILPFEHCLVCETGKICYPVRDGLPYLLPEEAFYLPPP
ncbi:MAG: hypothetical protein JOY92_10455 [Verrucomicrobia bacterium]|jgi:uncharacterized protein YbaR (Trm112 family)|nr:hypothetical protein [Verrucomicrobiota bacterium]